MARDANNSMEYFTLDEILKGRQENEEEFNYAYVVMFSRFLRCTVGKQLWWKRVDYADNDEDLCTVSDEAFTLLVLENNWERWQNIYNRLDGDVGHRRSIRVREYISDVKPKYTSGGIRYSNSNHMSDN